jgi:hypothetical protein
MCVHAGQKFEKPVGGHRNAIVHALTLCLTGERAVGSIATFSVFTYHSSFFASSPSREHHTSGKATLSIQALFKVREPSRKKELKTHTAVDIAQLTSLANDIADKTYLLEYRTSTFGEGVKVGMILGSDCKDAGLQGRVADVLWNAVCEKHGAVYFGLEVQKVHLLLTGSIKGQVSATTCVRNTNQSAHVVCRATGSTSTTTTPQLPQGPIPLSLPQFRMRAPSNAFARN